VVTRRVCLHHVGCWDMVLSCSSGCGDASSYATVRFLARFQLLSFSCSFCVRPALSVTCLSVSPLFTNPSPTFLLLFLLNLYPSFKAYSNSLSMITRARSLHCTLTCLCRTSERDRWISLGCFLWCMVIIGLLVSRAGVWPMYTFTMWSWALIAIRFLAIFVGENVPIIHFLGEFSHGPALINAVIVFVVWWMVLFPMIFFVLKSKKDRDFFFKFNASFNLINVHAVNIVLAYLIRTFIPRSLVLYDLWSTLTVSLFYTLLYLFIFDMNGYHFYIILSPRTHFCFLSYSLMLGIMAFIYYCLGGRFEL